MKELESFSPRPLNLHSPFPSRYLFTLLSSQELIQWVGICSDLSAINPNKCNISSRKTVILWLLYIIFILLFGSVSVVSLESALTRAERTSRISSFVFGIFTHITAWHLCKESLTCTPTYFLSRAPGSYSAVSWSSVKWSQIFICRLHAVEGNYVHIAFPLDDLKGDYERAEGGPKNIIWKPAFPHRIQCIDKSAGAKNVMTGLSLAFADSGSWQE